MTDTHKGACFCGAVEIQATGTPLEMGYCHCASCRSYSGAPLVAFTLWNENDVTVLKGADLIGHFNKTGMSDRQFCTRCGGHIMSGHPQVGLTDVCAAVFPDFAFDPTVHLNYGESVLPIRDGLTKLRDFPAAVGGSGESMPE